MKDRLILEGSLEAIMLPDVLTFLSMVKKTGRLELHRKGVEKTLFWKQGEVTFALSMDREESLGLFLLRNGKITEEEYKISLQAIKPGLKHGKVLVKMGYISPRDLWWGVKHQVLEIIYSTFAWTSGSFYFYELPESMIRQSIIIGASTTSLIMEGIRRLDEWVRIKEVIPGRDASFSRVEVPAERREQLHLSPVEEKILSLIEPSHTVQDLIRLSGLSEFNTYRILFTLLSAHLVVVCEAHGEEEEEDSSALDALINGYSDLFEQIYTDLSAEVGPVKTLAIFSEVLTSQSDTGSEIFEDVTFQQKGGLERNALLANVVDLPFQERCLVIDDALNTLLSYLLFEVSTHLPGEKKSILYHDVSERKAQLEKIMPFDDLLT